MQGDLPRSGYAHKCMVLIDISADTPVACSAPAASDSAAGVARLDDEDGDETSYATPCLPQASNIVVEDSCSAIDMPVQRKLRRHVHPSLPTVDEPRRRQALYRGCTPPAVGWGISDSYMQSRERPSLRGPNVPLPMIPHAPGAGGFNWTTTPRFVRKKAGDVSHEAGPYACSQRTISEWGESNPQHYSQIFATSQKRLSQLTHATSLGSSEPVAFRAATEHVGPGQYRFPPHLTHSISTPAGQVNKDDNGVSRGTSTLAARTAFRSTTPQLSSGKIAAFENPTGPGSYDPVKGAVEPWGSTGAGHRSSFASKRLQRTSSWHGRTWRPNNVDAKIEPVSAALLNRSLRPSLPSSRGHMWSKTPRRLNNGGATTRERGLDTFYSPQNGTIGWNLITGLHNQSNQNDNHNNAAARKKK